MIGTNARGRPRPHADLPRAPAAAASTACASNRRGWRVAGAVWVLVRGRATRCYASTRSTARSRDDTSFRVLTGNGSHLGAGALWAIDPSSARLYRISRALADRPGRSCSESALHRDPRLRGRPRQRRVRPGEGRASVDHVVDLHRQPRVRRQRTGARHGPSARGGSTIGRPGACTAGGPRTGRLSRSAATGLSGAALSTSMAIGAGSFWVTVAPSMRLHLRLLQPVLASVAPQARLGDSSRSPLMLSS